LTFAFEERNVVQGDFFMRYKSFRIRNFKGIKDTTVNLSSSGGAAVFAFVGLNESGKTTILEAIHSFCPDKATRELVGGVDGTGLPHQGRVPRHLISTFTGDVSVIATVEATEVDKEYIIDAIQAEHGLQVRPEKFPSEIFFERHQRFKDGDFQKSYFSLRSEIEVKGPTERRWRTLSEEERATVRDAIYQFTPDISYFPTFVFQFPEVIFLTERGGILDRFYKEVFQDILDFDGRGHTIEKDIVRRIRSEGMITPWAQFWGFWNQHDDRDKIQHVMDRASATVSKVVFGRWNKIFGEDTRGKEVIISSEVTEGEAKDPRGVVTKTNEHDIFIKFQIRDGTRRFNVNDRSLGFRWFFAFMLFTQFRVARSETRPVLFLFDEPAANLHAAAQQKLIESFPEIAKGEHALAYSTHSHYMIEPKWLEQTFIVTNRADAPSNSILDEISLDDESLDIKVAPYRTFVNEHPNQTSYFQPVLDRLEVVPSRFDIQKASVVVEGKSDYYMLRYAARVLGQADLALLPGLGAGTFGALVALHVGWNLNCLFILDADDRGKVERARYVEDYGIHVDRIATIDEFVGGISTIEDLVDQEASEIIRNELRLASGPTKRQMHRFFQERLASGSVKSLGAGFDSKARLLIDAITRRLA
jgi:ABC-type Na+ transport system ATPase subunit NatA